MQCQLAPHERLLRMQGIKPEVRTYNTIINACNRSGLPENALQVYERMLAEGAQPSATTYTALISAYGKTGKVGAGDRACKACSCLGLCHHLHSLCLVNHPQTVALEPAHARTLTAQRRPCLSGSCMAAQQTWGLGALRLCRTLQVLSPDAAAGGPARLLLNLAS